MIWRKCHKQKNWWGSLYSCITFGHIIHRFCVIFFQLAPTCLQINLDFFSLSKPYRAIILSHNKLQSCIPIGLAYCSSFAFSVWHKHTSCFHLSLPHSTRHTTVMGRQRGRNETAKSPTKEEIMVTETERLKIKREKRCQELPEQTPNSVVKLNLCSELLASGDAFN